MLQQYNGSGQIGFCSVEVVVVAKNTECSSEIDSWNRTVVGQYDLYPFTRIRIHEPWIKVGVFPTAPLLDLVVWIMISYFKMDSGDSKQDE